MEKTFVCPWWAGYSLNVKVRKLIHNPKRLLAGLVGPGMTAMDVGCGMGYLTLPMAEMVGAGGRVVAVDLQREMLGGMLRNAGEAGLRHRIEARRCGAHTLAVDDLAEGVDVATLFMMLHEVPDRPRLIRELYDALKPGARVWFAEPVVHVSKSSFETSLSYFRDAGFAVEARPPVAICRAAVLQK